MVRELIILKVANTFASLASGKEQALEGQRCACGVREELSVFMFWSSR